jgi:uncharacterized protein YeeX (DUF496 family)
MMTLNEIEEKQTELLKKVQSLFENKNRTQRDMDDLHDEIRKFEKERVTILYNEIFCEEGDIEK